MDLLQEMLIWLLMNILIKSQKLYFIVFKDCTKDEIWSAPSVELQQLNSRVSKFEWRLKERSKSIWKWLEKEKCFYLHTINLSTAFYLLLKSTIMIVSSISDQMKTNYEELKVVFLKTIERYMKKNWRLSYKYAFNAPQKF